MSDTVPNKWSSKKDNSDSVPSTWKMIQHFNNIQYKLMSSSSNNDLWLQESLLQNCWHMIDKRSIGSNEPIKIGSHLGIKIPNVSKSQQLFEKNKASIEKLWMKMESYDQNFILQVFSKR